MAVGPDYTTLDNVLAALYGGAGLDPGAAAPDDSSRDALLRFLITKTSRDFDYEVTRDNDLPGLFSPIYEARLFDGMGRQELDVDPFVIMAKVEINATPGQTMATWQNYTAEFTTGQMAALPLRGYPKRRLFRQSSFYRDPFPMGNVRLTALWGVLQADPAAVIPSQPWQGIGDQNYLNALAPGGNVWSPVGNYIGGSGWWVAPDDVPAAVTEWVIFRYENWKGGAAETATPPPSVPGAQVATFPSRIPGDVQRVINRYRGEEGMPNFALVAEGEPEEAQYRWAGWQAFTP